MKIFSTFDTTLKKKKFNVLSNNLGKENVHLLEISHLFFWLEIVIPILQGTVIIATFGLFARYSFHTHQATVISVIFGLIIGSIFYIKAIKKYIDYSMDYCIITPDEIILTQQEGIFNRTMRTLDSHKIKSIYVNKKSILYSIFDQGTIVFMSDGDEQFGEIMFDCIKDPEGQKERIQKIIGFNP